MFASMIFDENSITMLNRYRFADVFRYWALNVLVFAGFAFLIAWAISTIRKRNPIKGLISTVQGAVEGVYDIVTLPLGARRIFALATLSFRDAIRRKVLYVFVMFLIPFLFAGWYLPNRDEGQLLFLVAFVNNAITWLVLPLVVFVVSMSLPNDLKNRTIQTVVTKPVRRLEMVVGRVLGFMAIFTIVIAVMGCISLIYLSRQVSDEVANEQWTARVPIYASPPALEEIPNFPEELGSPRPLMFVKKGKLALEAINVGKEFQYRSHVEGETGDEARWYFEFDKDLFKGATSARLQLAFDIFKTTKGDPTRLTDDGSSIAEGTGVFCNLIVQDRVTGAESAPQVFRVDHHRTKELQIPADVLENGKVVVRASCLTRSQFIGMAYPDLYFLANEQSFEWNFFKGLLSIWLKVLLLTCLAVTASTVLNGFVTVLFTVMIYIMGTNYIFMTQVVSGEIPGGGPMQSAIRIFTQDNQVNPLDPTFFNQIAIESDKWILFVMERLARVIPNLSSLDTVQYVANGFDIGPNLVLHNVLIVVSYIVPLLIAGYFLLKGREVAA